MSGSDIAAIGEHMSTRTKVEGLARQLRDEFGEWPCLCHVAGPSCDSMWKWREIARFVLKAQGAKP